MAVSSQRYKKGRQKIMKWLQLKSKKSVESNAPGVYADLDSLIRIQFKARGFSFLPKQPITSILSGRYASRLRGRGLNFEEIRRYLPGDDIRTIDWKVTARMRKPHVRVYTEEKDRAILLLVDQRTHMFFGSRKNMKSVTAAEATALAAWRAISVGDRVGAIIFNDHGTKEIKPQRSRETVMQILKSTVELNHELRVDNKQNTQSGMLNTALEKAVQLCTHDHLVIIISDFEGVDEETKRLTIQLGQHNDVLGISIHDPLQEAIPDNNTDMTITDGEEQLEINSSDKKLSNGLKAGYAQELQNMQKWLNSISAPLLSITTDKDVADQVKTIIGGR